ncbi:MAG: maleylpyruvate isomerase family mycothiol-dependent enzyme [Segniliparus sp.]|uniref:maleylpyruvate isomerase family mycothiol-dependent enzyme n=1 Tax=Segniliparus sp. TaxID=2804064 RepID=UPI003F3B09FF
MTAIHLLEAERADLVSLLQSLSPEQWDAPTLCAKWRVRDVVAHVISYDSLGPVELAKRFVSGGLTPDRVNEAEVARAAGQSTEELLGRLQANLRPRGLMALFGGRAGLTDCLVHHQDIRRPFGLAREIPQDRLRAVLDFLPTHPILRGGLRARGTRLVATDLDWSWGKGLEVKGPGEALAMAFAGRPSALEDLSGPGVAKLSARA